MADDVRSSDTQSQCSIKFESVARSIANKILNGRAICIWIEYQLAANCHMSSTIAKLCRFPLFLPHLFPNSLTHSLIHSFIYSNDLFTEFCFKPMKIASTFAHLSWSSFADDDFYITHHTHTHTTFQCDRLEPIALFWSMPYILD